jgi:hypothetical protein
MPTVFLSIQLKGWRDMQPFLDLLPRGSDGIYSVERDRSQKPDCSYWKGFKQRTAVGLMLERLLPCK